MRGSRNLSRVLEVGRGGLSPGIILVTREMRELTLVTLLLVCEFLKNIEFPGDYTYPSFKIRACFMHSAL